MKPADIIQGKGLLAFSILSGLVMTGWSQNVGIGTATPHPSARLDVFSTTSGILIPRMTTAERDAIPNPENSVVIYNTTTRCFETYNALQSQWEPIYCMCDQPPAAPTALPATNITPTSFYANWSGSPQAAKYFLDVATDIAFTNIIPSFNNLDVGNTTAYLVNGVSCDQTYYYRVRAQTECGTSMPSNIIQITTRTCPNCVAIGMPSSPEEYGRITSGSFGGFVTVMISSFSPGTLLVTNVDEQGNIIWSRAISQHAFLSSGGWRNDIARATGGGYYLTGASSVGEGSIIKIDDFGGLLWAIRTINPHRLFRGITSTQDGGCAVIGQFSHDHCLVAKFDPNGVLSWGRRYDFIVGNSIVEIPGNGGYYITGFSFNAPWTAFVGRITPSGNILWIKQIHDPSWNLMGKDLLITPDGGVVCLIERNNNSGYRGGLIIKMSQTGALQWHSPYIHSNNSAEYLSEIEQAPDGGFYLIGEVMSGGNRDGWLVKVSANGNPEWSKKYGTSSDDGFASGIIYNGWLALSGKTDFFGNGDGYLVFLDPINPNSPCCGTDLPLTSDNAGISLQNLSPATTSWSGVNTFSPNVQSLGQMTPQCP